MKKNMFPIITSLIIGSLMAFFLISRYDNVESITVSKNAKSIYYIQKDVYSSKKNMLTNMTEFENYIYKVEDNQYHVYIGVTENKENANKIKKYYQSKGYDTYIKEKIIDNDKFITILKQYDNILSKTNDEGTIKVICNQVLSKYEELTNEY